MEKKSIPLIEGQYSALPARGITEETCKVMGYKVGEFAGETVHIAEYHDKDGHTVAQKLRFANKDFKFIGAPKEAHLFGFKAWRNGGKRVVITEGEVDALSVCQALGNKWPVLSVPNGAQGAKDALKKHIDYLEGFSEIILFFDDDAAGNGATEQCVDLFTPGKVKVAKVPGYKDANEVLMAGHADKLVEAVWNAKSYRPDGIMTLQEVLKDGVKPPEMGLPWFSPTLTKLTYGRRYGEMYVFGAGTGVGKTEWLFQQATMDACVLNEPIGVFFLESDPETDTVPRLLGKLVGKQLHLPKDEAGWTDDDMQAAVKKAETAKVFMYSSHGTRDWDTIRRQIRYLRFQEGVRIIYLDNLTSLIEHGSEDEQTQVSRIMAEIAQSVQELGIILHLVTHLATPDKDKASHEEGGRVMLKHFRGSRAIGYWAHYAFGLERDTQADNEEDRKKTTFRILKARKAGRAVGKVIDFTYDEASGSLVEAQELAQSYGF